MGREAGGAREEGRRRRKEAGVRALVDADYNDREVGRLAAEHLSGLGLRHFAYWGPAGHPPSVARAKGFFEALAGRGHKAFSAGPEEGLARAAGRKIESVSDVSELPRPVGVFAFNDMRGARLLSRCLRAGIGVPEEMAVLGVDNDSLFCDSVRPQLSSIEVNARRVGRDAAQLLERLMRGMKAPRRPVLVPPVRVVARRSTDTVATEDLLVREAIGYIRENVSDPIRVGDVAGAIATNRRRVGEVAGGANA